MRKLILILVVLSTCFLQTSCNMAVTSASAVYNRRGLQKTVGDQYITWQIFRNLKIKTMEFKYANIEIATYNGEVLLTGQVANAEQKMKVGEIAKQVPGVKTVYNLLKIANPTSPLTKMSDSWITTKVKAKLIATDDVDASQIKVVTENGTVYLMGVLPPDEANIAAEIASTTEGVQQVVKMFSYVTISKHYPAQAQT